MKKAYPGITQLECANVFKKVKNNTSKTIFEIMNLIQREISMEITLNEADQNNIIPIDPFEIIDTFYNNSEHVKIMKYYKIYSKEDKAKLPFHIQKLLKDEYLYTGNENRRRKLIKYSDGRFNYIPKLCSNEACGKSNCIYSHNDNELNYHPLFYKTIYIENGHNSLLEKGAGDFFNDFRIIYNYKDENIINLMKRLEEKKIAKGSYETYFRPQMSPFSLETFKTIKCPSLMNDIKCKKDYHLCYFYHDQSDRRRPPTLYRYINERCQEQIYTSKGKIEKKCKNGDFCNKCHTSNELNYHKLYFGKAIVCQRAKKNGKCIFEETCYGYHPYKEPGYKRSKEEIIQERKDELMDNYEKEYNLIKPLVNPYKCQNCDKIKKNLKFYFLKECEHIICQKCIKEKKK
jgi:hypothetical protein